MPSTDAISPSKSALNILVASPCRESWDDMQGDDKRRFCEKCSMNVHNLSAMSKTEIEKLLTSTEGRVCGRLYQRRDGTIITRDCPVGLGLKRRAKVLGGLLVMLLTVGLAGGVTLKRYTDSLPEGGSHHASAYQPKSYLVRQGLEVYYYFFPSARPMPMVMGEMVYVPPSIP